MYKKFALLILAGISLLVLSACMAQVEAEPIADAATIEVMESNTVLLEDLIGTPILEPVNLDPESNLEEEPLMEKDPSPNQPVKREDGVEPSPIQPSPEEAVPAGVQKLVELATEDLSLREETDVETIELLSFEAKVWSDSSLGCPQPGMMYLQVMKEGYLIRLSVGGKVYNYHGGEGRDPFLCEQPAKDELLPRITPRSIKEAATKVVPPPRD